ncbi:MAG: SBBP repeat-containing protein [Bryobacterales bacterium]|nr:SBBP repeat-containing protein [Bryobacterales bacterium]
MFIFAAAVALPLLFEPNWGQGLAEFSHVGRTANQMALSLAADGVRMEGVSYRLVGARRGTAGRLDRPMGSRSHYYLGSTRVEGVPHYERLRFTEVYPGTDVVYYSRAGQLEYDFLLRAGADASRIRMRFDAAPELLANGDLRLSDGVKLERPRAFQEGKEVAARFRVEGRDVGFALGAYDRKKPLRIDPVLVYSVGTGGTAIAADASGKAYVAGGATSPGGGTTDAFVAKLSPSGQLVWSAYLGGVRSDTATSVALDASGNVYVAGDTSSNDFPPRAENPTLQPITPWVFAARFGPDGTLAMSTVLVRDRMSAPLVGAHSASGAVFVYGARSAQNQASAAVVKLNAAGVIVAERAPVDSPNWVSVTGMTVDVDGAPYLAGYSQGTSPAPTAGTVSVPPSDTPRAFVMKMKADLTGTEFVVLLGGNGRTNANSLTVDSGKNIYVAGLTAATDYPVTTSAGPRGREDAFVTKLCPNATCIVWSTVLGGAGADTARGLALTADNKVWLVGDGQSADFPLLGAIQEKTRASRPRLWKVTDYGAASAALTDPDPSRSLPTTPLLSIDPSNPNRILWFGGGGVFRSADGGATWTLVLPSFTFEFARAPSNPNVVYQRFGTGFWMRSLDGGLTWTGLQSNRRVDEVSFDAVNPDVMYGRDGGAVIRSTNGGETFVPVAFMPDLTLVRAHPSAGNTVYAAGRGFIRRSTDGGASFTDLPVPVASARAMELVVHPANPNLIYLRADAQGYWGDLMFRSADGGMTYTRLPLDSLRSIKVAPSDSNVVYGLGDERLLVSRDMGATWEDARADAVRVTTFAVHPSQPGTVLAEGEEREWFLAKLSAAGVLEFSTFGSALGFPGRAVTADSSGGAVFTGGRTGRVADGAVVCTYEVTPNNLFLYGASAVRLLVVTGPGCAWTAESSAGWLKVTGSGPGSGWVDVRGEPNAGATRSGTITIGGQAVTVEQASSGCAYSVTPDWLPDQPAAGSSARLTVATAVGCSWKVDQLPEWVTASPAGGVGPGTVDVTIAPATARSMRSEMLIVGARRVVISQDGVCTRPQWTASRSAAPAAGGELTITVNTPAGCGWGWYGAVPLTVQPPTFGYGPGTLHVVVAPNTGPLYPARRSEFGITAESNTGSSGVVVQTGTEAATRKPRIVARNASGNFELYTYGVGGAPVTLAGGFAVTWASGQDEAGNVLLAALDTYGALSVARYSVQTNAWGAWKRIGGVFQGTPAVAGSGGTTMLLALRDTHHAYWTLGVTEALVVENLRNVGGIFGTDPALAAGESAGEAYVVGKDLWNALWSLRLPGGNWVPLGGVVQGKPSVAMGMDGLAYVAARDSWNGLWVARVNGSTAAGWSFLGGILSQDPVVQTLRNGELAVGVRDSGAGLWTATFAEGAAGSTGTWKRLGGVLDNYSTAGYGSVAYLAGKDAWNNLWWVRASDTVWSFVDAGGRIRGGVSSSPR